jgi:DNA-directed RNA polymerase beta subunit
MNIVNNQQPINQTRALVFYMNYRGYTFEDGVVCSESFAKRTNARVGSEIIYASGRMGIVSLIIPDYKMPFQNMYGEIADMLTSPETPSQNMCGEIADILINPALSIGNILINPILIYNSNNTQNLSSIN